jgi:N-methylhydantoinase A
MAWRVGVDVGGTFTDLVALDEDRGTLWSVKVPTTPSDPAAGVGEAVAEYQRGCGGPVRLVVHASTIGSNLFLGQTHLRPPRAALLTTEGFCDVLEIGRQRRAELYNLFFERPRPLIPRRYRFGVRERVDASGEVVVPLDEAQVSALGETLAREGVQAVAVCYLHSYRNPTHEQRTAALLRALLPHAAVVVSSEVDPRYREYERTSTTVVNALLVPVVSAYLRRLEDDLRRLMVQAPVYVMQSSGGMATLRGATALPAAVIESGPAAGVVGAAALGQALRIGDLLSFDMGGTTAKAGAVVGGQVQVVTEYEVGGTVHAGRIVRGSGYPVRFPFVDLAEVSAGGGTLAWADGDVLRVGPLSAGADPGPAAYGRGGTEPTVTDCNLVLGRLSARGLLGGRVPLDSDAAARAVEALGRRVGLEPVELAEGVLRILHTQMVRAVRLVSLERGYDPRSMTLVAFGGAGPMHAAFLADELDIAAVVVPPAPGLFSALGLLAADVRRDGVRAILRPADPQVQQDVDDAVRELAGDLTRALRDDGFAPDEIVVQRFLEMRYQGQSYELAVPSDRVADAVRLFHRRHQEVYGYHAPDEPVEVVSVRVAVLGRLRRPPLLAGQGVAAAAPVEVRPVFFGGWRPTPVYRREDLGAGQVVSGPAVIEQYDATTVVPPGWRALADVSGVLRLARS